MDFFKDWLRQCDLDDGRDLHLPIPSRIASNGEFIPPRQTARQQEYEQRLLQLADHNAKRLGWSRRRFLRSSCGMAAAFLAMNQVFGEVYAVNPQEAQDPELVREPWPKKEFIFDVQTHHIDAGGKWYESEAGQELKFFVQWLRPGVPFEKSRQLLDVHHYTKEIFFDSDTVAAVLSGVPSADWENNLLPPDEMARTRNIINQQSKSTRVLSHGLLRPNLGPKELDEMQRQFEELGVCGWKMYTGAELGEKCWWMNDDKNIYPFWERSQKLGIKNLCVHKGLPLGYFNEEHCKPKDILKAAQDWPNLNFIIYHSGFRGFGNFGFSADIPGSDPERPQYIPWISDVLEDLRKNPEVRNVYFELGSTFGQMSALNPTVCLHMLGQMLQIVGADHILWGTDSIWGGSPQSQIERLRRLQMPESMIEEFGYTQLTEDIKAKIFGLNAARLFELDVKASRKAIERDAFTSLRREYDPRATPSQTQFGWIQDPQAGAERAT